MNTTTIIFDLGGTVADLHKISLDVLVDFTSSHPCVSVTNLKLINSKFNYFDYSSFFMSEETLKELSELCQFQMPTLETYRVRVLETLRRAGDGVKSIFEKLVSLNCLIAISTNGSEEATEAILKTLKIRDLINNDAIFTSEKYRSFKSEGIINRRIKTRFNGHRIIAIGDSIKEDIIPALNEGIIPILVTEYCSVDSLSFIPEGTIVVSKIKEIPNLKLLQL